MLVGPTSSKQEIEAFRARLVESPERYIAQPTLALSACPTFVESGVAPRHIDLRPFVLSGKGAHGSGRLDSRRPARRVPGGQFVPGWWHQGHMGAGGLRKKHAEPNCRSSFWMARYMERAENLARMLEVNYRMALLPQSRAEADDQWVALLKIMSLDEHFRERHGAVTPDAVLRYMIFDDANPSSIRSCLRATRENAHAVRGTLTSELWETTNACWLKMRSFTPVAMEETGIDAFFEWVKYRSHLSRGVTIGTMLQDESLRFIRLGTFLERADNTARILDVKYQTLVSEDEGEGGSADYYRWSALLHSVSAFEVYRKVYRDMITPLQVAELLILDVDMPRSLARCPQGSGGEHRGGR